MYYMRKERNQGQIQGFWLGQFEEQNSYLLKWRRIGKEQAYRENQEVDFGHIKIVALCKWKH